MSIKNMIKILHTFEKQKLNEVMQIKSPWSVEAITPLGYAAAAPRDLRYKSLNEIFKVVK